MRNVGAAAHSRVGSRPAAYRGHNERKQGEGPLGKCGGNGNIRPSLAPRTRDSRPPPAPHADPAEKSGGIEGSGKKRKRVAGADKVRVTSLYMLV